MKSLRSHIATASALRIEKQLIYCLATTESQERVSLLELEQIKLPRKPDMKEANQRRLQARVCDLNPRGRSSATMDKGICRQQTQQGGSRQVSGPKNSLTVIN